MATLDINYVHVHLQKSNNILDSMNNLHFLNSPSLTLTAHNTITWRTAKLGGRIEGYWKRQWAEKALV